MSELDEHLARVQEISARARDFKINEPSNYKAFAATVVEDLGALAETLEELIKRADV